MVKRLLALAFVAVVAVPANAALTVQALYADAMAKENAVREALSDQSASEPVLKALRTAVATYESLVRRYPTSSYSDNALWQAARLSLDGFGRFGQPQDRDAGIRLFKALAAGYPSSKLASQVPEQLAAAAKASPGPSPVVAKSREAAETDADKTPGAQVKPKTAASAPVREVAATRGIEPSSTRRIATISGIRRTVMPEVVRVIIDVDSEVEFHEERISGPARIFVDFQSTRTTSALVEQTIRFDRDNDVVKQVRVGRHPNSTTRVVLDATGVSSYSVYPLYSPYRLVIDCIRETPKTLQASAPAAPSVVPASVPTPSVVQRSQPVPVGQVAALVDLESRRVTGPAGRLASSAPGATAALEEARALPLASRTVAPGRNSRLPNVAPGATVAIHDSYPGPLPSRRLAPGWGRQLPSVSPLDRPAASIASTDGAGAATVTPLDAGTVAPPPLVAAVPAKPAGPAPNTHPGVSMARQLGLGVSRIVIDPGHGGHDPGAKGRGITEAELVLDVALRLEKLLEENHSFQVILTRRSDDFIPLPERTAIANREGADLFLSIHANASPNAEARGIETYFLNFATNQSAAAVAARENSGSGQAMGALPDFVKAIALNNKLDESKDFATLVQHSMLEQLRGPNKTIKDLGVKQAPFVVLIGASMPSVLAEISFLTNPQELRLLKSNAYRQRIAEALSGAIAKYQKSLAGAPAVAKQQ
jgi:N-acetylmuramoyl-L-alanine amidase